MGRAKKRPPKEVLQRKYAYGTPMAEIAAQFGVNVQTVYKWLAFYHIPRDRSFGEKHHCASLTTDQVRWLMTRKGKDYAKDLASALPCSEDTIHGIWRYQYRYTESLR